jgi:hypothetical protein
MIVIISDLHLGANLAYAEFNRKWPGARCASLNKYFPGRHNTCADPERKNTDFYTFL